MGKQGLRVVLYAGLLVVGYSDVVISCFYEELYCTTLCVMKGLVVKTAFYLFYKIEEIY